MLLEFELGRLVITATAQAILDPADVFEAIQRHAVGDWGELCDDDRRENELSIKEGYRIFSSYMDRNATKFWIITEADRSSTTVLLPEDY